LSRNAYKIKKSENETVYAPLKRSKELAKHNTYAAIT
jgi:hypothetical protein